MNQQQLITRLKAKGYSVAFCTNQFSVLTRPVGNEYTGQVVHMDGTISTLKSVDAVRAINNEEINMSTYYTKTQLENMTEKERTALYNEVTDSNVARMRNKSKAVDAILAHQAGDDTAEPIKASQHNADPTPRTEGDVVDLNAPAKKKSIKLQVREILLHEVRGATPGVVNAVAFTVEELMQQTGGTKSSVQTALSDLKSDKYCGAGGKLNIMKTKNEAGEPAFTIHL